MGTSVDKYSTRRGRTVRVGNNGNLEIHLKRRIVVGALVVEDCFVSAKSQRLSAGVESEQASFVVKKKYRGLVDGCSLSKIPLLLHFTWTTTPLGRWALGNVDSPVIAKQKPTANVPTAKSHTKRIDFHTCFSPRCFSKSFTLVESLVKLDYMSKIFAPSIPN
ncbi:hypothetical protein Tsp_15245 [Trichinella spiralis]|uniref:hypothetical protein n=1 Tax=Trichinella spiralis TaxID=6334 RepID=UPI0001EFE471|nr:hypothetical protein Tsp_15245 [Trichinella spiralis]